MRDWEPVVALDGGKDGLKFYRAICRDWLSVLSDDGMVIVEVGEGQAGPVQELMQRHGLRRTGTVKDTAGTDRVVYAGK